MTEEAEVRQTPLTEKRSDLEQDPWQHSLSLIEFAQTRDVLYPVIFNTERLKEALDCILKVHDSTLRKAMLDVLSDLTYHTDIAERLHVDLKTIAKHLKLINEQLLQDKGS